MRTTAVLALALLAAAPAYAKRPPRLAPETPPPDVPAADASPPDAPPLDTPADLPPPAPTSSPDNTSSSTDDPNPNLPAADPQADDLWTWVARMEGEVPTPEEVDALKERADEQFAEQALIDELGSIDVPKDYYADPKGALLVDPLHLDEIDPKEFDIPITVNDDVIKWMRYFTGPGRKYYARWLTRSTRYRPIEYAELEKAHLPRDLVYLSMIESGYNTYAYSVADAAGLWQFIPSTARLYQLRVDWWVDERRDPALATTAGVNLLGDLHDVFGDWYLAWASYNTGPGRVKRAVTKAGTTDFWTIAKGDYLMPETDNYVPKIIAAAIIGHHPERYGFTDVAYQDALEFETAHVDGSVDLEVLAKCAGMSLADFQDLNPALRRFATPPEGYDVRLPVGKADEFVAALDDVPRNERLTVTSHRVVRGETLAIIAKKYGVSSSDIARANHLRDADRIYVGMELVIPTAGSRAAAVAAAGAPHDEKVAELDTVRATDAPAPKKAATTVTRSKYHTVKSGDTLSEIADKYDVSVSDVRSWNHLRGDTIYVGQHLKVGTTTTSASSTSSSSSSTLRTADAAPPKSSGTSSSSSSSSVTVKYTIKKGDTLSAIATKYGVAMSDLQKWNGIKSASDIQAGETLTIHTSSSGTSSSSGSAATWVTYTVKKGDSLGAIATKYGCSVSDIVGWNKLKTTTIQPGQSLKIRKG